MNLPSVEAENRTIRIGALLHLTGEFAIQGEAFREGLELGADAARVESGVAVELVFEDTRYQGLQALTGAKKLLAGPKLDGAVVSTATEIKSAGPEFQRAQIPTIVLWDGSPEVERVGDQIYSIGAWAPESGKAAADFAINDLSAKTSAVLHSNTEWSEQVTRAFQREFARHGGRVLAVSGINPDETDIRTSVLRVKRLQPDVVYVPADSNLISFFRQLQILTLPKITSDVITDDNLEEDAAAFEGIYQSMPVLVPSEQLETMLARYEARYRKRCKQQLFVAWGYDAARLFAHAAKEGVRFERVSPLQGATGIMQFRSPIRPAMRAASEGDDPEASIGRSSPMTLGIVQIRSGAFHPVSGRKHVMREEQ